MRNGTIAAALLLLGAVFAGAAAPAPSIKISVTDDGNQPVAGARVELRRGGDTIFTAQTGADGQAEFPQLAPDTYGIAVTKEGFQSSGKDGLVVSGGGSIVIDLTLIAVQKQSIEVHATAAPVEAGASPPEGLPLPAQETIALPNRPATVSDALPLIPGVMRSAQGGLQISGAGEHRGALLVNSADVTDPATGQFGLTVPIDSVDTLNVYQTPFLAEYGRFTSGLVSVETRRGGDKWKWDLNDPLPDFFIRSWHLNGLRDATPRVNFEGPLIANKLYFSEGMEYQFRKTEVYTLPFPNNQKKQEGVNSFSQLDWIKSQNQLVTATLHVAPQRYDFANLDFFNPPPTTPDASMRNYVATVSDHLTLGGGLLDNTVSATRFGTQVWPQGSQDMILAPTGDSGNYFAQQDRTSSRAGWSTTYDFPAQQLFGTHNWKVGSYVAESSEKGEITEHPVDIVNADNQLTQQISFTGGEPFHRSDTDLAFFAQDHWIVFPRLSVDLGVRAESQEISAAFRVAPRLGFAWNPFGGAGTVIRAGFGLFYDRVPLNVYSFDHYPTQIVTNFNPDGSIANGPFLFDNGLGRVTSRDFFVFQKPVSGNFSPTSANWSVQIEQPLWRSVLLRANYMQNSSSGLVVMNTLAPDPVTDTGEYLLSGTGISKYRQLELTARVRLSASRELFFSYVRSRAEGDLNDFANFLGTFPIPLIHNDVYGNLPSDMPNRFLVWGALQLPQRFLLSPVIEYRSGAPYIVTDAAQNYVGIPNQNRFPGFLSVDARLSKDFPVNPKYTLRFSVAGFNLTNHFDPEAVHPNIADPAYGLFFGQHGRRFTADFDVIF